MREIFLNWFWVIGGAILIALGTREQATGDASSFVDREHYTRASIQRFTRIEGYLVMGMGTGFIVQGLSGLGYFPIRFYFAGVAIVAIACIIEIVAFRTILDERL